MHDPGHDEQSDLRATAEPRHRIAMLAGRAVTVAVLGIAAWAAMCVLSADPVSAHQCGPGQSHDGGPNGAANPSNGHLYCWSYPPPVTVDPPPPVTPGSDPEGLGPSSGVNNQNGGGGRPGCSGGTHEHSYTGTPWCHADHTQDNGDCRAHRPNGTHQAGSCSSDSSSSSSSGGGGGQRCLSGQHEHSYTGTPWCHADHTQDNGDCRAHRPNGTHQAGSCGGDGLSSDDPGESPSGSGFSPQEFASGNCGGGQVVDDTTGLCRDLTEAELGGRVQCTVRDPADTTGLHTTTYLANDPPGCPAAPDWADVWQDRCTSATGEDLGTWDPDANGGAGGCTGAVNSEGEAGRPCWNGTAWVVVYADTVGCGASQCPVPGEPGNFIAGTNGQDCDRHSSTSSDTATTSSTVISPGVDAQLCWDGIYRQPGSCPARPPGQQPPTTPREPRPGDFAACRSGTVVRFVWSAVTVAEPQTGYELDGWEVRWNAEGSVAVNTETLDAADRTYERPLTTSNAWTVTITPTLSSGSNGTSSSSITVPAGDPTGGQCPTLPMPIPTVTACRSSVGVEIEWTIPSRGWATGTGWLVDPIEVDSTGSPSGSLAQYGHGIDDALPWDERSLTLAIPAGTRVRVDITAYDSTTRRYGPLLRNPSPTAIAEAQPETDCGLPAAPPAPSVVATCDQTRFAGYIVPWHHHDPDLRESTYEAQWRIAGSSDPWTTLTLTVNRLGMLAFENTSPPSGEQIELQVRGQARSRASLLDPWTPWSPWSQWFDHTGPTCPSQPPQPPTPVLPGDLAVDCRSDNAGELEAVATWTGTANTALSQTRYRITWVIDRGGTPQQSQVSPLSGLTDTITTADDGIAYGDRISITVAAQSRARTVSNGIYSPWSAWSAWSSDAGPAHDLDGDGDELNNGIADDIVGCPIPTGTTRVNNFQCTDPTHIAAVYPAGHYEAYRDANSNGSYDVGEIFTDINKDGVWTADLGGQPTGVCYPPGHQCLPPPHGTGAADVLCLPRGS